MFKPLLKFCGVRTKEDLEIVTRSKADYIGFIFAESKRRVDPKVVKEWLASVDISSKQVVAVFVNPTIKEINEVLTVFPIDVIQLHGNESVSDIMELKKSYTGSVWKALHHHQQTLEELEIYKDVVDGFIIDSRIKGQWGGTGVSFDWSAIPNYIKFSEDHNKLCFIAGGVNETNIQKLLTYKPQGIDLSSGIEVNEKKSIDKINQIEERVYSNMSTYPDKNGRYGEFGGRFVPETLMSPLAEIEQAHNEAMKDPAFLEEYHFLLKEYSGRPTTVTFAKNVTEKLGGAKIYLKREDLNHTGAHKINNAIGQALLAKRMGKTKIIAETGAGQHGVATATVAAKFGMECKVFMGEEDVRRQQLNVFRMQLLGAEVIPVTSGNKTLKDATNEAMRYWVQHCEDHFYIIGSAVGPHPYPYIVKEFQRVIGDEAKAQFQEIEGNLPTKVIACVGGGSNAIGMFSAFLNDNVELVASEAAGMGVDTDMHAATITKGTKGVLHGSLTYLIQDQHGQVIEPYSISAGLDYPGIGPEHAHLASTGRVKYESVTDKEALHALELLAKQEGILAAIESAHALATAFEHAQQMASHESILICLSGRGDKDVHTLMSYYQEGTANENTLQAAVTR